MSPVFRGVLLRASGVDERRHWVFPFYGSLLVFVSVLVLNRKALSFDG